MFSIGTPFYSSDGQVMYATSRSIALDHSLVIDESPLPQVVKGQSGNFYSKYDPGMPLLSAPIVAYADHLGTIHQANRFAIGAIAVMLVPALSMALAVMAVTAIAQNLFSPRRAIMVGLIAALGTMAWPYSRLYLAEAVMTACLSLGLWALIGVKRRIILRTLLASLCLGVGILCRFSMIIYLPALTFFLWQLVPIQKRWRYGVLLWSIPVLAVIMLLAHNFLRFGTIFDTGYQGEHFVGEAWAGTWGMLFSPGKSIFLYAPPIIMSVRLWVPFREHYSALGSTLFLLAVSALAFYGSWWAWHGGWVWGPRFLVPLLPLWCLPWAIIPRGPVWYGFAGFLATVGIAVQVIGAFINVTPHYGNIFGDADPDSPAKYRIIHYEVSESPILAGVEQAFNGHLEKPALFHLTDTGLPTTWSVNFPVVVAVAGVVGGGVLLWEWRRGQG